MDGPLGYSSFYDEQLRSDWCSLIRGENCDFLEKMSIAYESSGLVLHKLFLCCTHQCKCLSKMLPESYLQLSVAAGLARFKTEIYTSEYGYFQQGLVSFRKGKLYHLSALQKTFDLYSIDLRQINDSSLRPYASAACMQEFRGGGEELQKEYVWSLEL